MAASRLTACSSKTPSPTPPNAPPPESRSFNVSQGGDSSPSGRDLSLPSRELPANVPAIARATIPFTGPSPADQRSSLHCLYRPEVPLIKRCQFLSEAPPPLCQPRRSRPLPTLPPLQSSGPVPFWPRAPEWRLAPPPPGCGPPEWRSDAAAALQLHRDAGSSFSRG